MRLQKTIKKEIIFSGIGLHTGEVSRVKVKPAPVFTGIVFYSSDKDTIIRANVNNVVDTICATTIGANDIKIRTIEHFLAVTAGLEIDNLFVEIEGPEMPIMNGSAASFVNLFEKSGIVKQGRLQPILKITKPITYSDKHTKIMALPDYSRRISFHIDFNHTFLKEQNLTLDVNRETFIKEISPARTFVFFKDIEKLQSLGLIKGGTLENAIVINGTGVINPGGLIFEDEFVRHKMLDAIGDLALVGLPIEGHIIFEKSGHNSNINFLKRLISSQNFYSIITEFDSSIPQPLVCN